MLKIWKENVYVKPLGVFITPKLGSELWKHSIAFLIHYFMQKHWNIWICRQKHVESWSSYLITDGVNFTPGLFWHCVNETQGLFWSPNNNKEEKFCKVHKSAKVWHDLLTAPWPAKPPLVLEGATPALPKVNHPFQIQTTGRWHSKSLFLAKNQYHNLSM